VNIRTAKVGDAAAICAISNEMIRHSAITFTSEDRRREDVAQQIARRGDAFVVAERDGRVVGFATFAPFRAGPGYVHTMEHSVHLAPGARGAGLGRALMARIEAVAVAQGVHVLVAAVSGANPAGETFHTRLGYRVVGRMAEVGRKDGVWLDLVLMQKILTAGTDSGTDAG